MLFFYRNIKNVIRIWMLLVIIPASRIERKREFDYRKRYHNDHLRGTPYIM
jgi:hypothetical protein